MAFPGLQEAAHPEVPFGTTMLFAAILVGLIASMALEEKLHAKKFACFSGPFSFHCRSGRTTSADSRSIYPYTSRPSIGV